MQEKKLNYQLHGVYIPEKFPKLKEKGQKNKKNLKENPFTGSN